MAKTNQAFPLPPPDFAFLVESILLQAQMQLGLLRLEDDQEEQNLPLARHSIDLLTMLQEKTAGNLTTEEHRLIENGLTELHFRYVQVVEELERNGGAKLVVGDEHNQHDRPLIITPDGGKGSKTA
jgi:Domain of unknown function (DUF1844)